MEKDSKRIILRSKGIFGAIDHWPWKLKKGHLTSKGIIVGLEHQKPTEMPGSSYGVFWRPVSQKGSFLKDFSVLKKDNQKGSFWKRTPKGSFCAPK